MEVMEGWLPPILSRIAADRSAVAVPVIDRIRAADLAYTTYADFFAINGFRWHLIFSKYILMRFHSRNQRIYRM